MVESLFRSEAALPDSHSESSHRSLKLLWIVLGLRVGLFLAEVGIGLWIHSLSLLAVAGHMMVDVLAIAIALVSVGLAERTSDKRIEAWAALGNGFLLLGVAVFICWGALQQTNTGLEAEAGLPMMAIAVLGFLVKATNATLLYGESQHSLNIRGVFLHAISDAANSVSLLLAAVAIFFLHWLWADVAASLLVTLLILVNAIALIWESTSVLIAVDGISDPTAS